MLIILCINHVVLAYRREGVAPPPPQFTSSRWRNVPHEGRLRSVGCKGSRPRCAAMYILRITGCLLLRCLSCCSSARSSCGGICPHTDTPPCRREAYETRVPPACGRTQERLCAYSYSNSIIVCWPWFVSNSPTHPSYLVESVVEYPPYGSEARRAAQMVSVYSYSINIFGLSTSCPLPPRICTGLCRGATLSRRSARANSSRG